MPSARSGLVIAVTFLTAGCASRAKTATDDPVAQLTSGFDADVRRDVETLRAATSKYHDLAVAQAAGYPTKVPACIAQAAVGGMGHHYIDRSLIDEKLEIERPEMLIYAPAGKGKVELVAVEYVLPFRVHPATEKPPRLFGQELKPYPEFKYWGIHVWAWKRNAAGLFAEWNPAVKC
jgi:hypothetical protein